MKLAYNIQSFTRTKNLRYLAHSSPLCFCKTRKVSATNGHKVRDKPQKLTFFFATTTL